MDRSGLAGFSLAGASWLVNEFEDLLPQWQAVRNNLFRLRLGNSKRADAAIYHEGFIEKLPCLERNGKFLPARGVYRFLVQALNRSGRLDDLLSEIKRGDNQDLGGEPGSWKMVMEALEGMINDGWVEASYDPQAELLDVNSFLNVPYLGKNTDNEIRF